MKHTDNSKHSPSSSRLNATGPHAASLIWPCLANAMVCNKQPNAEEEGKRGEEKYFSVLSKKTNKHTYQHPKMLKYLIEATTGSLVE